MAVVGGSICTEAEADLAEELGRRLAEGGAIVLCGGLTGVMESVARGVRHAGGLTIGILPGSREKEIERLLPVMLEAAQILCAQDHQLQFLLMKASSVSLSLIEKFTNRYSLPLRIIGDQTYNGINASTVCMVTSGTATLETAILQKPMIVVYKTSLLTWLLAKFLIKIPYIGLVNVVAGKKIVPECIQFEATPQKIAQEIKSIYTDRTKMAEIKSGLQKVKESLGEPGASHRAAEAVIKILKKN